MSGHIPVLLQEIVDAIDPLENDIIVDGTFGGGGYTKAILDAAKCRVLAIDRDPHAIERGKILSPTLGNRLTMLEGCYGDMAALVNQKVNAVVLDIGVSSFQIDESDRGFSFRENGPLDMRMSQNGESAADVVNTYDEKNIADIIYKYGEERRSRQVAHAIVEARKEKDITTTSQLARIVRTVVWQAKDKIDPATRTFQGLRIYVNDELGELERGLQAAEDLLLPGGRLVVVTFHSLEDRIVKKFFKERSGSMSRGNRYMPDDQKSGPQATFKIINRRPTAPGEIELSANPRARSSKLRAALRTDANSWSSENAS